MSEFVFTALPNEPSVSETYKSNGSVINVVQTLFNGTLSDGTYVEIKIYASKANAVPAVGDLIDYDNQYTLTVDKVV